MTSTLASKYLPAALALLCYLASSALLVRHVTAGAQNSVPNTFSQRRLPWLLAVLAVLLHAMVLASTIFKDGAWNLSFFNSLSATSWITVVLLLLMCIGRPLITLGLVVFPVTAIAVLLAIIYDQQQALTLAPQIQWHAFFSILAYGLLTMAAVQSILVSMQDKRLHAHKPGGFLHALPALKPMEDVLIRLLITSFTMLVIALITGFVFLDDLFAQRLVHKTILSLLALCVLAVLLAGHYRFGWRGQKAATMTLGAYILLLLAYFGSKFVKELVLS